MFRNLCLSVVAALLPALTANAAPPEGVQKEIEQALRLVPHDASGFLVANQFSTQIDKWRMLEQKLGTNRQGDSRVDQWVKECPIDLSQVRGTVTAVFLEPMGEAKEPGVVYLLRVQDQKKLLNDLGANPPQEGISEYTTKGGHKGLIASRDDYILMTTSADDRASLQHVLKSEKNITQDMKVDPAWLARWDIAAVATPEGWQNHFKNFMQERRQDAANREEGREPNEAAAQAGMLAAMAGNFMKNVNQFAIAGRVHEQGHVQLASRFCFKDDSPYANMVGKDDEAPKTLSLLEGLPDEKYILASGARVPPKVQQQLFKDCRKIFQSALSGSEELTQEQQKEWATMMDRADALQARIESMTFLLRRGEPQAIGMPENLSGTLKVKDARSFVGDSASWVENAYQLAARHNSDRADKRKFTRQQISSDGTGGEVLSWVSEEEEGSNCHLVLQAIDESTVVYLVHAGSGARAEQVKALIGRYQNAESSLTRNKGLAKAAELLPATAHETAFFDLAPCLNFVFNFASERQQAEQQESVPVGYTGTLLPDGAEMQVVLHVEMMQQVAPLVNRFLEAARPQEGKGKPEVEKSDEPRQKRDNP